MTLSDLNNALKTPSAAIGSRLQGFALAVAPAVAFAYTAGFVTGKLLFGLNDYLTRVTR